MRTCRSCAKTKQLDSFYSHKGTNGPRYWDWYCKECQQKRQKKSSEYRRKIHLKMAYNISLEEFEELALEQDYCCKICEIYVEKDLHVDHDHKTGKIRGLLCGNCNVGLGYFRDSIINLSAAITYLNKSEE